MAEAYPIEWLHRIVWRMDESEPYSLLIALSVITSDSSRSRFSLPTQVSSSFVL